MPKPKNKPRTKRFRKHRIRKEYGHFNQALMRKIAAVFGEEARVNRPGHIAKFFAIFESELESIESAADTMLLHTLVKFHPEFAKDIADAYSMLNLVRFAPFADHLEYDEERRLENLLERLRIAWQKFFAVIKLRKPGLAEKVDALQVKREGMADLLSDFYLGEILPRIPVTFITAGEEFAAGLDKVIKEFEK